MKLNKKGFSAVFLTMIFGVMIMLTFAFIRISSEKAVVSSCDAVFTLAGQSVLSEFDLPLKERYGLLAFGLSTEEVDARLRYYANATFNNKRELNMIPMKLEQLNVDNKKHSMIDVNEFEEAILDCMKFRLVKNLINMGTVQNTGNGKAQAGRTLRNHPVMEALPSAGISGSGFFSDIILNGKNLNLSKAFETGTTRYMVDAYIRNYFNSGIENQEESEQTFFKNEQEYILYGKASDAENKRKFRDDFIELRTGLNLAHIYSDGAKIKQIVSLANLMTPGPESIATQAVIAAAWAYGEALNDAKLIEAGETVPLMKVPANWALNISSYKKSGGGFIKPPVMRGYTYGEYLGIFLYLEDREIKLLRIMDLIQLNLTGTYDENFLMANHYTGFSFSVVVNGKNFEYEEEY